MKPEDTNTLPLFAKKFVDKMIKERTRRRNLQRLLTGPEKVKAGLLKEVEELKKDWERSMVA